MNSLLPSRVDMFRGHATGGPRGTASSFRAAIGTSLSRLEVMLSEHKR